MAERIQVPPTLMGDTKTQLNQIYNYLFRMSEVLNRNLQLIGDNGLTEREQAALRGVTDTEADSMKDMLVALANETASLAGRMSDAEQRIRYLNNTVLNLDTDETDLNNITEPGNYWIDVSTFTHKPSSVSSSRDYVLQVLTDGTIVKQLIWGRTYLFMREYYSGSWQSWRRFTSEEV